MKFLIAIKTIILEHEILANQLLQGYGECQECCWNCEKTDENIVEPVELLSYQLADYPCRIFIEYTHSNGKNKRKLKQVYSRFEM